MGELKKIVVEGYPVERLPQELRDRLESQAPVRITIEQQSAGTKEPRPLHEMFGFAKGLYASQGLEPTDFIRQLRDEWE